MDCSECARCGGSETRRDGMGLEREQLKLKVKVISNRGLS